MNILDAVRQKSAEKAEAKEVLTQEMLARNGRHPPKPTNLSNNLPEGKPANPPLTIGDDWSCFAKQPVPGVYENWSQFLKKPDKAIARALTDAGYMSVVEYVELYGDDGA